MNPVLTSAIKEYVANGGGFIGIGEPTACQNQGRYFTLASVLGVDKEIDFGEGMNNIFALPEATVIKQENESVQIAVNEFGEGRSVYLSGLPYSFENARMLYRSIFWAATKEKEMKKWYSDNYNVEVNFYPSSNKYCIVNNTYEKQDTVIYDGKGESTAMNLKPNDIIWLDAK